MDKLWNDWDVVVMDYVENVFSAECIIMTEREFHNFRQFYPTEGKFSIFTILPCEGRVSKFVDSSDKF